ncbi:MAG: 3'(2'),5'-bisphosphate nucleotidase CysQ [Myxococcales bacterium]|nr:3'(2'),5'-bisphosphate nucleotidase CysQ [Myxococcales bacterium]
MSARSPADELAVVVAIARRAAALVLRAYGAADLEVAYKGPNDPVTSADRASNDLVCRELARAFPEAGVVAEESAAEPGADVAVAQALVRSRVFFVDPLDGTREFLARNGEFAVMIGLCEAGRPVLGVVALPVSGELYAGRVGGEAWWEDAAGCRASLRVSRRTAGAEARIVASRSHAAPIAGRLHAALGTPAPVERCGSVGVKVARLCRDLADVYVHDGPGVKKWDSCGPEAVLAAAGGRLTDLGGGPIDYAEPELALRRGLCATNGLLHPEIMARVAEQASRAAR